MPAVGDLDPRSFPSGWSGGGAAGHRVGWRGCERQGRSVPRAAIWAGGSPTVRPATGRRLDGEAHRDGGSLNRASEQAQGPERAGRRGAVTGGAVTAEREAGFLKVTLGVPRRHTERPPGRAWLCEQGPSPG